ncbi:MAG: hypothetical protein LQ350_008223 [Teloschistes chrysophthalmus]|nr:MAG: hypothetical protein LQ350_008223 [Niorma chrysophthalma]
MAGTTAINKRRMTEKFRRRKNGLLKKADELATICSAEVCVLVKRQKRYSVYQSVSSSELPPWINDLSSENSHLEVYRRGECLKIRKSKPEDDDESACDDEEVKVEQRRVVIFLLPPKLQYEPIEELRVSRQTGA